MVERLELRYIYRRSPHFPVLAAKEHFMDSRHTVHIGIKKFIAVLVVLSLVFIGLSLLGQWYRLFPDSYTISGPTQEFFLDLFIDKFSVNTENNVPTYFNTIILAIAALLVF